MSREFRRSDSLGWLMAVVGSSMAKDLDAALRSEGLSLKLWPTLMCLWEQEGMTQAELSRTIKVSGYTTTRTLDRLQSLGLVERRVDPQSRRAHNIYLTDDGRGLQARLTAHAHATNERYLALLDDDERDALLKALMKIVAHI